MKGIWVAVLLTLVACSDRNAQWSTVNSSLVAKNPGDGALWLSLTDFQNSAVLARLDLKKGTWDSTVRPTRPSVQIVPGNGEEFFLLSQRASDAITWFKGPSAEVGAEVALQERENPQYVARDTNQNLWVVSQDSNLVQIFSSNLKDRNLLSTISIASLHDSKDGYAEPSWIGNIEGWGMVVLTARLQRSFEYWIPEEKSGLAVFDPQTLKPTAMGLIDVSNAFTAHCARNEEGGCDLEILGKGDLSQQKPIPGGSFWLNEGEDIAKGSAWHSAGKVIAASAAPKDLESSRIEWYPAENKSCLIYEDDEVLCQEGKKGFLFSQLVTTEPLWFVAYADGEKNELWVIDRKTMTTEKFPLPLPIGSAIIGP